MLNVCFGDSERGLISYALDGEKVMCGLIYLEYGGIHPDSFKEDRRAWIERAFDCFTKRKRRKLWENDWARVENIISIIKAEKEVRIWYANNPGSKCAFYFLVHALQGMDCRIFAVEMPADAGFRRPPYDKAWGEANPYEIRAALSLARELGIEERCSIAEAWEKLAKEDAELRLNVDGRVTSVPIDYMDKEILSYAPQDKEFSLGSLVGNTLGVSMHFVSDSFIAERIESLIDAGELVRLKACSKRNRNYYSKTILRLATDKDVDTEFKKKRKK